MRHRLLNEMFSRLVLRLLYYELLSFVSPDRETAEPFAYRKLSAGYSAVTKPSHRLLPTCVVVVSKFCQDLFQKVVSVFLPVSPQRSLFRNSSRQFFLIYDC